MPIRSNKRNKRKNKGSNVVVFKVSYSHATWLKCILVIIPTMFMEFSISYIICEESKLDAHRSHSVTSTNCQYDMICQHK